MKDEFLEHRERRFFYRAAGLFNRRFQKTDHIQHMLPRKQVQPSRKDSCFKDRMSSAIESEERTPFASIHNG